jgi:endonuclease V-like protein UPF0215 family
MTIPVLIFTACIAAFIGIPYFANRNEGNNAIISTIGNFINTIIDNINAASENLVVIISGIVTGIFILFDAYAVFLAVYIIVISVTAAKKPALEQNNKPAEEGLLATEDN